MRTVILSDIHDRLESLQRCLDFCAKLEVQGMICAGDLVSSESLRYLGTHFSGPVILVRGNGCRWQAGEEKEFPRIRYLGELGNFDHNRLRIGLCHEDDRVEELSGQNCDLIIHGHTHVYRESRQGDTVILCPGSISGEGGRPGFVLWEPLAEYRRFIPIRDLP